MDVYSLKVHQRGSANPQAAGITQLLATFSSSTLPSVCFPQDYFTLSHSSVFTILSLFVIFFVILPSEFSLKHFHSC